MIANIFPLLQYSYDQNYIEKLWIKALIYKLLREWRINIGAQQI